VIVDPFDLAEALRDDLFELVVDVEPPPADTVLTLEADTGDAAIAVVVTDSWHLAAGGWSMRFRPAGAAEAADRLADVEDEEDDRPAEKKIRPPTATVVAGKLRLTADARRRCLQGQWPAITLDGSKPCPIKRGYRYNVTASVWLEIGDPRPNRFDQHSLPYLVHDERDPRRFLRRTPTIHQGAYEAVRESFDAFGKPRPEDADTIAEASEESSYTSIPSSLADAGEAPPADWEDPGTDARNERMRELHDDELRQRGTKYLTGRIRQVRALARATGADDSELVREIEKKLDEFEREHRKPRAA